MEKKIKKKIVYGYIFFFTVFAPLVKKIYIFLKLFLHTFSRNQTILEFIAKKEKEQSRDNMLYFSQIKHI